MSHPSPSFSSPADCWILSDGKPGTESQCLGLARALGLVPQWRRVRLQGLWRHLHPKLRVCQSRALAPESDPLLPPWPKVLITGGRQAVASAVWIKRQAGEALVSLMVQDPRISARPFDLIICPEHDRRRGQKVISTLGSLHRLRQEDLTAARAHWPALGALPAPRVAVLVGGSGGGYVLEPQTTGLLADRLMREHQRLGGSLLVTTSRRTGADNAAILQARLKDVPGVFVQPEDTSAPPLAALLGWADATLVTQDSVTMVSEAALLGRPLYLVDLPGGAAKFTQFYEALVERDIARPLTEAVDLGWGTVLDETARVAGVIRARLGARLPAPSAE